MVKGRCEGGGGRQQQVLTGAVGFYLCMRVTCKLPCYGCGGCHIGHVRMPELWLPVCVAYVTRVVCFPSGAGWCVGLLSCYARRVSSSAHICGCTVSYIFIRNWAPRAVQVLAGVEVAMPDMLGVWLCVAYVTLVCCVCSSQVWRAWR